MITPWNYPLLIISQKLPFALAVGCCAVVKPSEMTSGTTSILGRILLEAGVPPGVVNIVPGYGDDIGVALCESPDVDMISFTGSTRVGKQIARIAGGALKKVSLELGGKSAHIVCADADLAAAAQKVALGATRNAGQACVSGSRLLVERRVAPAFVEARARAHEPKIVVGDPFDPATEMGPLISAAQYARVSGYVAAGRQAGATLWSRPETAIHGPHFVQPSIFTGVLPDMSDRPGGDLRAGAVGDGVRLDRRGDHPRQRHEVRPVRGRVDARSRQGLSLRPWPQGRAPSRSTPSWPVRRNCR
jgi:betaine-aldehyde dehydrogenase